MIGFGSEDDSFVLEFTYNYDVKGYSHGDDMRSIGIQSSHLDTEKADKIQAEVEGIKRVVDPSGYFIDLKTAAHDAVSSITLVSTNFEKTKGFWGGLLGLTTGDQNVTDSITFQAQNPSFTIKFLKSASIDHAEAYGRIAFAVPTDQLLTFQEQCGFKGYSVLKPYIALHTPGKATVHVVILADPDGYEVCLVGDEGFRALSKFDPSATTLLDEAISEDKSDEYFAKRKNKQKFDPLKQDGE